MQDLNGERKIILLFAVVFSLLGLLMIYESSSIHAWKTMGDAAYFLKRQILYLLAGLICFFGVLFLDFRIFRKYCRPMLLLNILLLLGVLLVGRKSGGARRWLGILGFAVQPSEFLKLTFFLYCTDYLQRKGALIRNFRSGLLPLLLVMGVMSFLIVLEPDFGTVIFWAMWLFIMLFLFNAKKRHLGAVIACGVIVCAALVLLCPYRFSRLVSYLHPWDDPRGSGFQLIQSQIAYGAGGFLGVGFGESKQKLLYLPAAYNDFIFSIFAEEFGFVGSVAMLAAFFFFAFRIVRMGMRLPDPFLRNICMGIGIIFALEFGINLGVSCGLFPTKGLSLPFISYGGSSLCVHYALIGLLFNATREGEKDLDPGCGVEGRDGT